LFLQGHGALQGRDGQASSEVESVHCHICQRVREQAAGRSGHGLEQFDRRFSVE
jgi:hypothetical protein